MPSGCMECSNVVVVTEGAICPHCGSTDVYSIYKLLDLAISAREMHNNFGLDNYED